MYSLFFSFVMTEVLLIFCLLGLKLGVDTMRAECLTVDMVGLVCV